ncbi:MAG: N-acetylglucosaminyldiphosphoundecaprenol N-acetyl-beta-D-mannosaminyltransferase [candidate division WS2 bacterium]|uniref:N-acetylglucosaminyldiphosphoundecaprenol N-acetyl-beta-D-mannosaminyltransferase n=1 Tax=Psychracetigena formicireducens TaxID=2986056 RepID=A0A9E2F699_PSYF1|nr:N-acetylglucosaminyldiphosphoundecaprenol N-acetyl-beta-D-mannosaminyltransferase [Candidatus Psychracetigena formicireducens]MBT9144373.1 N-acetylglucosaminyldiphosphoundecaprenol N-acetyl-beta-D-mannosaminyltransferase [Candidatus Psychracetigena formicireducens]MBT9150605.1 N-acetylglucosaminyldiphosphoundecaprenol N-acetyl-beta-D-mannosaminyltransferase [Candidatus Psychracetigena formicireducens]
MRTYLWDVPVDLFSKEEALELASSVLSENIFKQVVTLNLEMLALALKDKEFLKILNQTFLIIPDGKWITLLLRIGKQVNTEHIPGITFVEELLSRNEKVKIFLLGARQEVIEKAVHNLTQVKKSTIIGYHHGYFNDDLKIANTISQLSPDILIVGMGSPRQEKFIFHHRDLFSFLTVGVGGSLDIWGGFVKRAPVIYRQWGLEWLYRLVREPKRYSRILVTLFTLLKTVCFKGKP